MLLFISTNLGFLLSNSKVPWEINVFLFGNLFSPHVLVGR